MVWLQFVFGFEIGTLFRSVCSNFGRNVRKPNVRFSDVLASLDRFMTTLYIKRSRLVKKSQNERSNKPNKQTERSDFGALLYLQSNNLIFYVNFNSNYVILRMNNYKFTHSLERGLIIMQVLRFCLSCWCEIGSWSSFNVVLLFIDASMP